MKMWKKCVKMMRTEYSIIKNEARKVLDIK